MNRRARTASYVDAWPSPDADTEYSVSLGDDVGGEIRCLGGGSAAEAWDLAVEEAEARGLTARELDHNGDVVREWTPS